MDHEKGMGQPPEKEGSGPSPGLAGLAFDHFRNGLLRFLLRRLRSREDAEDLAQEVFLRLLRFADQELVKTPRAYVYQVAFNVLCEFKLNERRNIVTYNSEVLTPIAGELEDDATPPEVIVDEETRRRQLDVVLDRLPPMQHAVFVLAIRHGLAHANIAQRLNISTQTVRKHLYLAIHCCRQQLVGDARTESR